MPKSTLTLTRNLALAALLCATAWAPQTADALVANALTMQGRLLNAAGAPVPDGTYALTVHFYAAAKGGKPLHSVSLPKTPVKTGIFSAALSAQTPNFLNGKAAWVGVKIAAEPELPRVALHKVPYAVRADTAVTVSCTGCITTQQLAAGVLSGYAKTTTLSKVSTTGSFADLTNKPKLVALGQACAKGQVVKAIDANGKVVCQPDANTQYTGKHFALSLTGCPAGQAMVGVLSDGKPQCAKAIMVANSATANALGARIINVKAPAGANDAATKGYVDSARTDYMGSMSGVRYAKLYDHNSMNPGGSTAAETHPRLNMTATRANFIGSASFELVGSSHVGFVYSKGPKAIIYSTGNVKFSFYTHGSALYVDLGATNFLAVRSTARLKLEKVAKLPAGAKPVLKLN